MSYGHQTSHATKAFIGIIPKMREQFLALPPVLSVAASRISSGH